jgi:fumarate hydratase class II
LNANEVIATLAGRRLGRTVHPNDHVNLGQNSNDVIPAAIHVSAACEVSASLMPALGRLSDELTRLPPGLGCCGWPLEAPRRWN